MANRSAAVHVAYGNTNQFAITSSNGGNPQLVKIGSGVLSMVINNQATAQTAYLTVYDTADITQITVATRVFQMTLGASENAPAMFMFASGLWVRVNGASLSGIIWLVYS